MSIDSSYTCIVQNIQKEAPVYAPANTNVHGSQPISPGFQLPIQESQPVNNTKPTSPVVQQPIQESQPEYNTQPTYPVFQQPIQANQPIYNTQPTNPVFQSGVDSVGGPDIPYPIYTPPVWVPPPTDSPGSSGVFDIGNFYKIPEDKVVPAIREVRYQINNTDLSGKTDLEKYEFIEGKFADAFGKDFLMARDLSLPSSMFYMIGIEFTDTLNRIIEKPEAVNRERLYGDKSIEEVQKTIRDKYPSNLTNRDLLLMTNEMRSVGVLDSDAMRTIGAEGANNVIDTLTLLKSYAKLSTQNSKDEIGSLTLEERDRRWADLLNKPVNNNNIYRLHNAWAQDSRFTIGMDVAAFIMNFLGGVRGSDGLFEVSGNVAGNGSVNGSGNESSTNINKVGGGGGGGGGGGHAQIEYGAPSAPSAPSAPGGLSSVGKPGDIGGNPTVNFEEDDWDKMLSLMLKGMDDYDNLIRSRMAYINSVEHPGIEDGTVIEDGTGVEGGAGVEEGSEVEDGAGAESGSGAEENTGADEGSGGEESPED